MGPILVHDGVVHIESNDIIKYVDNAFATEGLATGAPTLCAAWS